MSWFSKKRIYMDAAAATPIAPAVKARMLELFDLFGNPGALHLEGVAAKDVLENARREAAEAIGAHADEIVFTASGTEANNLALYGVLEAHGAAHSRIITTAIEHPSVLEPIAHLEARGARVTRLPVGEDGVLDMQLLARSVQADTVLISVGLINSEIGTIQDVREIAKLIRSVRKERAKEGEQSKPLLFHIDAAQAPLWIRLRVEEMHPDLLTLDAQKMGGPKGVGLLFVRRGVRLLPHIRGGGQERGLRSGTENVIAAAALARALAMAQSVCEANTTRVAAVRDTLFSEIQKQIPDARYNGSVVHRVANNCNISIPGLVGERAVIALSSRGIAASTRSACAAKDEELSHVLRALYPTQEGVERARTAVRFTLLPDVTHKDAVRAAQALASVAATYRNIDF